MNKFVVLVQRWTLLLLSGICVLFLATPLLALCVGMSPGEFASGLGQPLVWPALRLSLFTTSVSLVIVVLFGTPLAWLLARRDGWLARTVETVSQLPIVMPPAVAGVALLFAFGRHGLVASWFYPRGCSVTFTTTAVIMAEVLVSAPFFLQGALSAFRGIDEKILLVSRSFGAGPYGVLFGIAIPLAAPGLLAGAAMSWARSLGEFGATLMFAGNLRGETQTLPLAIYAALESDVRTARALSLLLVVVALLVLLFVRGAMSRASGRHRTVL